MGPEDAAFYADEITEYTNKPRKLRRIMAQEHHRARAAGTALDDADYRNVQARIKNLIEDSKPERPPFARRDDLDRRIKQAADLLADALGPERLHEFLRLVPRHRDALWYLILTALYDRATGSGSGEV